MSCWCSLLSLDTFTRLVAVGFAVGAKKGDTLGILPMACCNSPFAAHACVKGTPRCLKNLACLFVFLSHSQCNRTTFIAHVHKEVALRNSYPRKLYTNNHPWIHRVGSQYKLHL